MTWLSGPNSVCQKAPNLECFSRRGSRLAKRSSNSATAPRGAGYRYGLRISWALPPCDRREWGKFHNGHPMGWPSCERLALRGIPSSRLPARLTGLTARFTGLGFIDREGAPLELLTLEPGNSGFRRGAVGHLDESKAFGAAGVAVGNNTDLVHNAIRLKELAKVMVGGGKRQIANINIHGRFLVGNGAHNRQVIRTV